MFIISGMVAIAQSPTIDTLRLYRGGQLYFLKIVTPDTAIINGDTLLLSNVITSYSLSNDTLIINGTDTMLVARPMPRGGYMYHKEVSVSIAEFDAMHTDSVTCIPAPGVGKYINVIQIVCRVISAGRAEIGTGHMDMVYNDDTYSGLGGDEIIARLLNNQIETPDTNQYYIPFTYETAIGYPKQYENEAIVIWLTAANTGDDTSLKLYITYQILNK